MNTSTLTRVSTNGKGPASYSPPPGYVKAQTIDRLSKRVQTFLTMLTPEIAEIWLGHNSHNRTLRNRAVEKLEGVIERGEWFLNGEAIKWSKTGVLLDGQHRLWAVVNTGISVPAMVVVGLEDEAQETVDVGERRSLKDALTLRNETSATDLAASLNYWWRYENDLLRYADKPSIAQALALLDANPGLRDAAADARRFLQRRFKGSTAQFAACFYELRSIENDDADEFFNKVETGESLSAKDPRLLFRHHMEQYALSGAGTKASSLLTHALCIKAWNFWRDGRYPDRLSWKSGGMRAEEFPVPH